MKTPSEGRALRTLDFRTPRNASDSRRLLLRILCAVAALALGLTGSSCRQNAGSPTPVASDPRLTTNGTVEVTAQLEEIPDGAIFQRDLYDYATILKYRVLKVHRGVMPGETLYVGHYNPWKPRAEAADKRVKGIGGNVRQFEAGQIHRMALQVPIEDHFMGGLVNKYFGRMTNAIYWAVWTHSE